MRLHPWSAALAALLFSVVGCGGSDEGDPVQVTPGDAIGDTGGTGESDTDAAAPGDTTSDTQVQDVEDSTADAGDAKPDTGDEDATARDAEVDAGLDTVDGGADADSTVDAGPIKEWTDCDSGDIAWAKRALEIARGRRAVSVRELEVLADLVKQTDRATVARGLLSGDAYIDYWQLRLMDELRVNRVGIKQHDDCFGEPNVPSDNGEVAAMIRDNEATHKQSEFTPNMTDVLRSSLKLDDLSPAYRAYLFAMMAKPIDGANVSAEEMDIARRQDFGEIFSAVYTNRNVVCTGCHNSEWAVTDSADPESDRHWQIPGLFEKAIYGASNGRPEMEVYSMFRHLDVVLENSPPGSRPWSMTGQCGAFRASASVPPDPIDANYNAYFLVERGDTANIWQVEEGLHNGFDKLRETGLVVDPDTMEIDPEMAFAYMVSARVADRVWRSTFGYPLTLVHYFSRNEDQRDLLLMLTDRFVESGFSLRELLVEVMTHPLFNQTAPLEGCSASESAYLLPEVFNPWTKGVGDPDTQLNSIGDAMHRVGARTMLTIVESALGWPSHAQFHKNEAPEEQFQRAIGVFTKDAEPGFDGVDFQGLLAWENRYAACRSPYGGTGGSVNAPGSCVGYCGEKAPEGCWCDKTCEQYDDCCPNKAVACDGATPTPIADGAAVSDGCVTANGGDWIGLLICSGKATDGATLRSVVTALKDRLVNETQVSDVEAALIADFFDVESLDVPLAAATGWDERIRNLCGVLLESPHFLVAGMPPAYEAGGENFVVGATSYRTLCVQLAAEVLPAVEFSVKCQDGSLTVTPAQ